MKTFHIACTGGSLRSRIEITLPPDSLQTDEVTALPDPVIQRVGRVSSEMVLAPRFQMRGLETISMARRNGRGPGSCLKRVWVFVQTRVYTV